MKKYLQSASMGITVGLFISIITSGLFGNGSYSPLNPFSTMGRYYLEQGNQVTTMLISVGIWALIGLLFQGLDTIFEQDWSLFKMVSLHFLGATCGFLPLAILAGWFPLKPAWLLLFFALFLFIYGLLFFIHFQSMKKKIQEINAGLGRK